VIRFLCRKARERFPKRNGWIEIMASHGKVSRSGEIPEPTVKVRMEENSSGGALPFALSLRCLWENHIAIALCLNVCVFLFALIHV
jgi:hypothetical protein